MTYNPALSHFDLDMKRGAAGELFVLDICKMLAEGSGTIEVKTDYRFFEKQRFYIEIVVVVMANGGHPDCLSRKQSFGLSWSASNQTTCCR
jgi:hypothetical protein